VKGVKLEYEIRTVELQEQMKELPQALNDLASWQEFGRTAERYGNDCLLSLKQVFKESGRECIDAEVGCPIWAENGQCLENPGYMLLSCGLSCNIC
jgi:hypothetical protein